MSVRTSRNSRANGLRSGTSICAAPPLWHSALAGCALVGSFVLAAWALIVGSFGSVVAAGVLLLIFAYATADALTMRMWIADGQFLIRDRVLRVRSVQIHEVTKITFVPNELFRVETCDGRRVAFPAGATGVKEICRGILETASVNRTIEFVGNLGKIDEQS